MATNIDLYTAVLREIVIVITFSSLFLCTILWGKTNVCRYPRKWVSRESEALSKSPGITSMRMLGSNMQTN